MRRIPWIALSVLLIGLMGAGVLRLAAMGLALPSCPFKSLTGFPCATCGGTRCLLALAQGKWGEALYWHPVVFLLGLGLPWAALWDGVRALQNRPYPSLPSAAGWRWGAVALLAGTWALQVLRGI